MRFRPGLAVMRKVLFAELAVEGLTVRAEGVVLAEGLGLGFVDVLLPAKREEAKADWAIAAGAERVIGRTAA